MLQLLANGTHTSAIADNIAMHAHSLGPNAVIQELPSETCIKRCRGTLRILCESCSACRLGKSSTWKQLHTNDTSRRQTCITSLVVLIKEGGEDVNFVTNVHCVAKAYTTDRILLEIEDVIDRAEKWVERLKQDIEVRYPAYQYRIPATDDLNLGKL